MVGSPAIATASNLTRTKVRELIDGFAEPFWMARWKTVARWFIDRRFQLAYLNEEALVVPRACDKPEFGPCALVAATLLTDWGEIHEILRDTRYTLSLSVAWGLPGPVLCCEHSC